MAVHDKRAEQGMLFDIKLAKVSWPHRFYLKQEKKILGAFAVIVFLWEFVGGGLSVYNPIPSHRINPTLVSAPSLIGQAPQLFSTAKFGTILIPSDSFLLEAEKRRIYVHRDLSRREICPRT